MRRIGVLLFVVTSLAGFGCDGGVTDNRIEGPDDAASMLSCSAPGGAPVTAASSADTAASAVIELPTEALAPGNAYRVTLPGDAETYAVLRVGTMHNDVALFVSERDRIVGFEPDGIASSLRHAQCPDTLIDDYRVHVHEPGDYRITFAAGGPREFTVVAILAVLGHGDLDGGMHMHDEDGGHLEDAAAHDHDGGHDH